MEKTEALAGGLAHDSDDALAVAARTDPEALGLLYERHHLAVYRYLRARGLGDEQAGDLTAATFERALVRLGRFTPRGAGFRPWLMRIARNLATDAGRRQTTAVRWLMMEPPAEPAPDPAQLVIRNEEDRLLAERLRGLAGAQREALILRYAGGLTAAQIGDVIGRSPAATQKLLTRALAALKEAYRDDPR